MLRVRTRPARLVHVSLVVVLFAEAGPVGERLDGIAEPRQFVIGEPSRAAMSDVPPLVNGEAHQYDIHLTQGYPSGAKNFSVRAAVASSA
jgi:hypothetical protein